MILAEKTDTFLIKVYKYYIAKGYWPMIFSEIMSIATLTFFVLFTVTAFTCIDFREMLQFDDISQPHIFDWHRMKHMNPFFIICLIIFGIFFGYKIVKLGHHVKNYWYIRRFYHEQLQIHDFELRTIAWNLVVKRIQTLQMDNQIFESLTVLDALEIANRIMRKDNYLVAMINKDLLDFRICLQFPEHNDETKVYTWLRKHVRLNCVSVSKAIEWNIGYCLVNYFFDENMHVKDKVKSEHVETLTHSLRMRFRIMALVNLILLPFILVYVILYIIFKYGEQFYKDPKRLGSRNWSRMARWKFREFNELPHVFEERLKQGEDHAREYVNQFPSKYLDIFSKFLVFVLSSFLITVLFMGLFNAQLFTKDVVWWITMFGTIIAISRVFISDTNQKYPHENIEKLANVIHYIPPEWEINAHKEYVFKSFLRLFEYRVITLLKEIVGVILSPFMLWFVLAQNANEIVRFFKDCTVKQPGGLGLVCEFAMFNLSINGDSMYGSNVDDTQQAYQLCRDGKMEKSFVNFQTQYPDWNPRGRLALLRNRHGNPIIANSQLYQDDIYRKLNQYKKESTTSTSEDEPIGEIDLEAPDENDNDSFNCDDQWGIHTL